jgi:dihydroxyacetone kinase-like protein
MSILEQLLMDMTVEDLIAVLRRCADQVESFAPELNELDGKLGDGDLGVTLEKCAAKIRAALEQPADTVDCVFKACAIACTRASGSSFGTLLGVAFLTSAKETAGRSTLAAADFPGLMKSILDALMSRGGAALGDKTVLDPLDAVRLAITGQSDRAGQYRAALAAVDATLDEYRSKPNRIGRARMFAERSIGMDDPGMVAFSYLLRAAGDDGYNKHGKN